MNRTRKRMFKKGFLSFVAALLISQMLVGTYGGRGVVHAESGSAGVSLKPLTSMVPGKARFAPGETAALTIQFNNESTWHGNLHVQIYQLDTLIAEGTRAITVLKDTDSALDIKWQPPSTDFRGYMAKAWVEGAGADDFVTAAIDVSSDWTHFPRYGYVSEFPQETPAESDAKLKQLSQEYYVNAYQFYDWMWRHDVSVYSKTDADGKPLRDANGNFITAPIDANTRYTDLLGRSLYPQTIKQEISAAQKYGASAMAYEMNYAARENYQDYGVKPEWGLYNKTAPTPPDPQKDQVGFFFDGVKPHPTALYLQDPGNPEWQAYITKEFVRAVKEFGFDGIHLDQWGAADNDYLLDYAGKPRYFSLDFDKIINATKDALNANTGSKNHVTFNMVGGNAGYGAVPNPNTKTDFDYSEIWQDKNRYGDLKQVVNDTRNKDGGKAMVIAGYMNYKQATGIGYDASEAKDVPHTVVFQSRINRAPSWVGDFGKQDEDKIIFTVQAPEAGNYDLTFHYGHGNDGGNPEGYVTVNGAVAADSVPFDQKTGWGNPIATRTLSNVPLKAGENKIMLQLHSNNLWLNLQSLDVAGHDFNRQYQAVFAELISCKVDQFGNVYYFETDGDYVTFHVYVLSEGDYPINFSYGIESEAVKRNLYVNGTKTDEWAFPSTGGWDGYRESAPRTVHLHAGDNTVTLKDEGLNDTGMKLQYLSLNGNRYMAEQADIGWAPTQAALIAKVPGTIAAQYAQNIKKGPHFIEFTVHSDEAAVKQALFSYGTLNNVHGLLQVNGSAGTPITFESSGGWGGENKLALKPIDLDLRAGDNTVRLTLVNENNYLNLDGLYVGGQQILVNEPSKVTLSGSVKVNPSSDKDAKTDDFNSTAGTVTFSADSAQDRPSTLRIWYRSGNDVTTKVTVTGAVYAVSLPHNDWYGGDWWGYVDTPVQLHAGSNPISVQVDSAGPFLNLHGIAFLDSAAKVEAEAATDKNGVDNGGAFTGGFGGTYDTVTFPVSSSAGGKVPVKFRYKSTEALDYQLSVGSGTAPVALRFNDSNGAWAEQTFDVNLTSGSSTLRLQPAKDLPSSILLNNIEVEGKTTEAEDASVILTGGANIQSDSAEVGYIGNFKQKGDYVQFAFGPAASSGETVLKVNYKNENGAVERAVYVNGRKAGTLELPSTGSAWGSASLPIYLQSSDASNKIMVKKEDDRVESGILIDSVETAGFKLEAEDAETGWQPVVPRTGSIASAFGKTDDFGQPGQAVTFGVNVTEAVDHFDVLYHTGNNPAMTVSVDGTAVAENIVFPSTSGGWDGPDVAKTIKTAIPAGHHTVTLTMTSGGQYMNLAGIAVGEDRYAVADAALTAAGGNAVKTSVGYAGDFKDDGDFITFSIKVPAAGEYNLGWKYRNDAASKRNAVRTVGVNGSAAQTVSFPSNESWSYVSMNNVHFNQGMNEVTISVSGADDDGIQLDHLKADSATAGFSKIYEAEYADFLPPMTLYKDTILNFGHYGDTVSFDVDVPQAGETSLIYTYSNPGSFTSRAVYIDGQRAVDLGGNPARIGFDGTGNTESYSEDGYFIAPYLSKGTHRVTLKFDEASEKGSIQIRKLTLGYFNEPSLRLMDAGLAAMGATHIELGTAEHLSDGPNMLAHEYYPNRSKKMPDAAKESMKEYYKFYAGYENLLFDSREDTSAAVQVKQGGSDLPVSTDGKQNTVWYTVRKNGANTGFERYDVIHLINLLNNDNDWRNAAQDPTAQTGLQIKYPIGISKDEAPNLKVYAASPDTGHGMSQELNYVWNGTDLVIDLPSLQYWSMIYVDKNPQTVPVQTLSLGGTGPANPPTDAGGNNPGQGHSRGTIVIKAADLQNPVGGKVVVKLDGGSGNDIRIPMTAIESLKNNQLVVQGEQFSLQFDSRTIRQLLDANRDQLDPDAGIRLNIRTIDGGQGVWPTGNGLNLTGRMYELELGVEKKDGELAKLSSFDTPVRFSESYVAVAEQADLLGVYYFNESTKTWEYVGGKIDRNGKTITADLPHFSKYAVLAYEKTFSDVASTHWAYADIRSLAAKHILSGLTEQKFGPAASTTRAEFAAFLVRALGLKTNLSSPFRDVQHSQWYAPYVSAAYEAGLINGRNGDTFAPNAPITRQEMAVMLVHALEKTSGKPLPQPDKAISFKDGQDIASWARPFIERAANAGLMAGDGNGDIAPKRNTTRAEAAKVVSNLLKQL